MLAPPRPRFARKVLSIGAGMLLGLGIAEAAFCVRDGGSFPRLNTYVADPKLGVRLAPGARTAIRFGSKANPRTKIQIGPEGYREALPSPSPGEILVVGDSQVFGLGVEAHETFAHVLQKELSDTESSTKVLNLGVPTYGPKEFVAVLEEQLRTRKPRAVVFTVNMVNDLFEVNRPNIDRHGVLDGWAVRKENMPSWLLPLPFRSTLFGRSHLVYAWRRYWGDRDTEGAQVSSEGSYADLLEMARDTEAERRSYSEETNRAYAAYVEQATKLQRVLAQELTCEGEVRDHATSSQSRTPDGKHEAFPCAALNIDATEGDTRPYGAEESRILRITAEQLRRAALLRAYRDNNEKAIAEVEQIPAIKRAAVPYREAREKYVALRGGESPHSPPSTPLSATLERLAALGKAHDFQVVVLILPIDVAVSSAEWAKYGVRAPSDMSAVNVFSTATALASRALGLGALDATPLLAAAEPGAFLDGDIHMTPKGHRAVAHGLAGLLRPRAAPTASESKTEAAKADGPTRRQMLGVSYAKLRDSWRLRDRLGCIGMAAHDGFTLACPPDFGPLYESLPRADSGEVAEVFIPAMMGLSNARPSETFKLEGISAPNRASSDVLVGRVGDFVLAHSSLRDSLRLTIHHGPKPHTVSVRPSRNDRVILELSSSSRIGTPDALPASDPAFLACAEARPKDDLGPADPDCTRTYADSCELMLACSRGADYAPPRCKEGQTPFGTYGRCAKVCTPGASGSCSVDLRCETERGVSACVRGPLPVR